MNRVRRIKDSFVTGLASGSVSLVIFYYLFTGIRTAIIGYTGNAYLLRPPTVQMLTMIINVILFRLIMINLQKEKTGKGFLFVTVMATFVYFFIFYRIKR